MQPMGESRDWGTAENKSHVKSFSVCFVCGVVFFKYVFIWKSIPFGNDCFGIFPLPHCIRKARFHTFSFNQYNSTFTENHMHKMFQNVFQK